ncbi:MAG: acetyltransferase, partial [Lautropia sp.]|nr:acetyltransferase [Lautropia sp.]
RQAGRSITAFEDLSIIGLDQLPHTFPPDEHEVFIAITYAKNNQARRRTFLALKQMGYRLATFLSPHAHIAANTIIGENCLILEGVTLQPFTRIGDDVFIWCGSTVCHHSTIGEHSFLASNVTVSGNVEVGEACFLGANATLRDDIKIDSNTVIGAGTLLLHDAPGDSLFIGQPSQAADIPASRLKTI